MCCEVYVVNANRKASPFKVRPFVWNSQCAFEHFGELERPDKLKKLIVLCMWKACVKKERSWRCRSKQNESHKPASISFVGNESPACCGKVRLINLAVENPSRILHRCRLFPYTMHFLVTLLGGHSMGLSLILDHPIHLSIRSIAVIRATQAGVDLLALEDARRLDCI